MPGTNTLQSNIQKEIVELSTAIGGLVNSFKRLQNPLEESRNKVPQATDQLDKINEQTEAAAHQMLDMIEQITAREEEILEQIDQTRACLESGDNDKILSCLRIIAEKAQTNLNDSFLIMDALQFQDITSQQMNHAASLLEDIEHKLHTIIGVFDSNDGDSEDEKESNARTAKAGKVRAFDPHADLFEKKTNQNDIDSLFDNNGK